MKTNSEFLSGMAAGIPIGLGYLSVSFGFGIAAVRLGISVLSAVVISLTNLTSAGQAQGIDIIAAGGTLIEMALVQLVINLRYALMAISLSQRDICAVLHTKKAGNTRLYVRNHRCFLLRLDVWYTFRRSSRRDTSAGAYLGYGHNALRNVYCYHYPAGSRKAQHPAGSGLCIRPERHVQISASLHFGRIYCNNLRYRGIAFWCAAVPDKRGG